MATNFLAKFADN